VVDETSPVVYGVSDNLVMYSDSGDSFNVSASVGGAGCGGGGGGAPAGGAGGGRGGGFGGWPMGCGTLDDLDVVQGWPANEGSNLFSLLFF